MATTIINGLGGYQTYTGSNILIAAYGNDLINVATGMGYGIPINNANNMEFENFLQSFFFQNYADTPLSFNGTVWSRANCGKVPISRYIKQWNDRLYLGYVKIAGTEYPSRIWYSDLPKNNAIVWGYETGTNLVQIAGNTLVSSANAGFVANNIKRGDPFYITTGPNSGQYAVQTVSADQQIILTTPLLNASSGDTYWVGGNYIDVARDDGDFVTGLDVNFNKIVVFKRDSLWRYDGSKKVQIPGAVGTTSARSIGDLHELAVYFYGGVGFTTGFYSYNGAYSNKISAPIEDHIQGINPNIYNAIVSWVEGDLYRAYVGTITNSAKSISITNAVCTYSYNTRSWSVDPINDVIKVATDFRQAATKQIYWGTDSSIVLTSPTGNTFNGATIPFKLDTIPIFPSGTEVINTFTRVQVLSENAGGVIVNYKRHLKPFETDEEYRPLGQISGERSEFYVPEEENQSAGIQISIEGSSIQKATTLIKKITLFYIPVTTILQ